jgi:hypothetical protein
VDLCNSFSIKKYVLSNGIRIAFFQTPKGHANEVIVPNIEREGRRIMDFAVILILSNALLAVFIYIVVTKIWQD